MANSKDSHPILIERTSYHSDVTDFRLDAVTVWGICKVSLWEKAYVLSEKKSSCMFEWQKGMQWQGQLIVCQYLFSLSLHYGIPNF